MMICLNTSHVKVQLGAILIDYKGNEGLNTSHVKVQPLTKIERMDIPD